MTYHDTLSAAQAAQAAFPGSEVVDCSCESNILPPEFWAQLRDSPAVFARIVREHADQHYRGGLEAAWLDAIDGNIRGLPAAPMLALDVQFRRPVRLERWVVSMPDAISAPATQSTGNYSPSTGDGLRDAATWAKEAYASGDSISDE